MLSVNRYNFISSSQSVYFYSFFFYYYYFSKDIQYNVEKK